MTQPLPDIAADLERCFREIEETRMQDVPILNRALRVKAVGMREWRDGALCALVTPWFINLMLSPAADEGPAPHVGEKRLFAFPAGQFEFIRGHEEAVGPYWMCSLFSPVFEFADQETAEAVASASLEALMQAEETPSEQEAEMAMIWRGETPREAIDAEIDDERADGPEQTEAEGEAEAEGDAPTMAAVSRRALLRGRLREEEL